MEILLIDRVGELRCWDGAEASQPMHDVGVDNVAVFFDGERAERRACLRDDRKAPVFLVEVMAAGAVDDGSLGDVAAAGIMSKPDGCSRLLASSPGATSAAAAICADAIMGRPQRLR